MFTNKTRSHPCCLVSCGGEQVDVGRAQGPLDTFSNGSISLQEEQQSEEEVTLGMGSWKVTKDPPQDSFLHHRDMERKQAVAAGWRGGTQRPLAAASTELRWAAGGCAAQDTAGSAGHGSGLPERVTKPATSSPQPA